MLLIKYIGVIGRKVLGPDTLLERTGRLCVLSCSSVLKEVVSVSALVPIGIPNASHKEVVEESSPGTVEILASSINLEFGVKPLSSRPNCRDGRRGHGLD
ncbi:hypothetical protein NE237_022671 [Protea cynaroides]|uniref:Uncharacterized protein n=1 Tax=Protea cynaroides TaxID=273540 RepID=A0A9Q0K4P5_9MAGN|nr:hypothetical protein NE237_022671 [Protea cynaroides]